MFGHDRRIRLADITDGTSHTLLLLEDGRDPAPWARGGPGTVRGVDPRVGPAGTFHRQPDGWLRRPAVTVVAFADGSYRSFGADTDPAVLAALATVAGGEPLPPD